MSEYPARLGNGQDTAPRMRAVDAAVRLGTTAVRARGGLRPDGGGAVSVSAGTMNVTVTPFSAWIDVGSVSQVGFPFVLDSNASLAIAAGHASLTRIDVVAVVADSATPTTASLQVVQGTPGAGAPTLPAYAVPLRNISVHAGASAGTGGLTAGNLSTDRRVYSVAAGGILPVASSTERDAVGAKEGQVVYRADTDVLEAYNGTGWDQLVKASQMPKAGLIGPVTSDASGYITITHGLGAVPSTALADMATAGGAWLCAVDYTSFTSTTFKVRVFTSADGAAAGSTANLRVSWAVFP